MSFADYLACKRFELSVEIFYNDRYLEEIHGLARSLGLPMFEFVERCHAQFDRFPDGLRPSTARSSTASATTCGSTAMRASSIFAIPPISSSMRARSTQNSLGSTEGDRLARADRADPRPSRAPRCGSGSQPPELDRRRCSPNTSTSSSSTADCAGRACSTVRRSPKAHSASTSIASSSAPSASSRMSFRLSHPRTMRFCTTRIRRATSRPVRRGIQPGGAGANVRLSADRSGSESLPPPRPLPLNKGPMTPAFI